MKGQRALAFLQQYQGLAGLALLLIVALVWERNFFVPENLRNVLNQCAVPGTLAIGMTFVILTGGIDLSVGSQLAFLNCIVATWLKSGTPAAFTVPYVLVLGVGIGAMLGYIIGSTRLQPFVVTLAAMVSLRGLAFVYTKNANVSGIGKDLDPLKAPWFGLPLSVWILFALAACSMVILRKTVLGRRIYAIGGGEAASHYSGVPVNRTRVAAYALNGFCVAVAAILLTARTNNGQPGAAQSYELDAIAAAVVGGSSLLGGYGNSLGSVVGALFILSTDTLLNLKGIDDKVGLGLKGVILLIAVYVQNIGRRR
ncbi:MAG: ABC transporter permease [Fimbriimonadaceae bacterium]|nr:ABC transporter permease [Fimbriimonadaceae bacterium]